MGTLQRAIPCPRPWPGGYSGIMDCPSRLQPAFQIAANIRADATSAEVAACCADFQMRSGICIAVTSDLSVFNLLSSVFCLPPPAFGPPSSVFCPPPFVFRLLSSAFPFGRSSASLGRGSASPRFSAFQSAIPSVLLRATPFSPRESSNPSPSRPETPRSSTTPARRSPDGPTRQGTP